MSCEVVCEKCGAYTVLEDDQIDRSTMFMPCPDCSKKLGGILLAYPEELPVLLIVEQREHDAC